MTAPAGPARQHLLDLDLAGLQAVLAELGQPAYRAAQVWEWVYARAAADFSAMTNLPAALRTALDERFEILSARELRRSASPDGTTKLLLAWPDAATTETVMIPATDTDDEGRDHARRTVCVSTQVGCDVGCRFCASGIGGALRDLTVGQIVEQALRVSRMVAETPVPGAAPGAKPARLSHVVFMGMGEPLANYKNTVAAIRRINSPWGLNIAARKITVSTVGLPKQIEMLAAEGLQITLALSLHAPNDPLRKDLIPWARGIALDKLLAACRHYFDTTGREVTLEYCLLKDVNDQPAHAKQLSAIARALRGHVNVMMYNPVSDLPFERPSRNRAVAFLKALRDAGVNAHLRHSRGLEADAACGQLRRRAAEEAAAAPVQINLSPAGAP